MKILHVLPSPRAEGTPRLVLDWLQIKEYDQEVLFLDGEGELKNEFDKLENWKFYNRSFIPRSKTIFKIIALVHKIAKERKPDMVIAWVVGFSPWIHIGARTAGIKNLIVHVGNPPGEKFRHKYLFTYLCFWIGQFMGNKAIACSEYIYKAYLEIPFLSKRQFHWVYNCFRPDKFYCSHIEDKRGAIMVATLEAHKDHQTLLYAWKMLEDQGMEIQLQIVGEGRLRVFLFDLKNELELRNVSFLGSRSDISHLLAQSRVFILSTTMQEGFGTVLLEALASGCKIVASDVPACREVLQDGTYGALVKYKDPVELAMAIKVAFASPFDPMNVQKQVDYASGFTPRKMIKEYLMITGH